MLIINNFMRNRFLSYTFVVISHLIFTTACASGISKDQLNLVVSKDWGEATFSQYTAINKTSEWRYNRKNATLIVTQTECKDCTSVSQQAVDEYNNQEKNTMAALLLDHKGVPAMLRLYSSPKGVNFFVFQIVANGYQYEIQLGINLSASHEISFSLQKEFISMINEFTP